MISNLWVYHSTKKLAPILPHDLSSAQSKDPCFLWQTCLRTIAISFTQQSEIKNSENNTRIDVFQGLAAYEFLLEIISGMHSPLMGETEVFGQFKQSSKVFLEKMNSKTPFLQLFQSIFADVKQIRSKYLTGIGGSSYGSLVRQIIKDIELPVILIGAGQLGKEILPWLSKSKNKTFLVCRNTNKHQDLNSNSVTVLSRLDNPIDKAHVLIIAAPISNADLKAFYNNNLNNIYYLIDLRSEDQHSEIIVPQCKSMRLSKFFSQLNVNKQHHQNLKEKVISEISLLSNNRIEKFNKQSKRSKISCV